MNKLFSKIAALSVGLTMAVGVGVAASRNVTKEAKASDGSYVVSFSTTYNEEVFTLGDGSGALDETKLRNGTTYSVKVDNVSYNPVNFASAGFDNVSSVDTITNIYAGRNNSIKVGKGGGDGILSLTYPGTIKLTKVTITAFALANGVKLTVGGIEESQTIANGMDLATDYVFNYPSTYSGKALSITGGSGKTSSNKPAYIQAITVEYENITTPSIASVENVSVGAGMSVEVPVTYANLSSVITVDAPSGVSVPSSIDVTGSGETTLEIQGVDAGLVDVTLTSGTASATIHVTVVQPTEYTLLTDLNLFTEGSKFTIVAPYNDGYYYPSSFGGNCYNMTPVDMVGEGSNKHFSSIDAITYTIAGFDTQGALIKEGDNYIGSTNITAASLTRNTDLSKITYSHWDIQGITDEIAGLCLVGEEGDNNRFIKFNYNSGNPRIANYKTGYGSGVSIYTSYLAPDLYLPSKVGVGVGYTSSIEPLAVNFGDETVSYSFNIEQEGEIVSAIYEDGTIKITGVGSGAASVTVIAQSEHYGPVSETIEVEVYDTTRELTSLTLSVPEETLYKGQEYSYSGTVTANYSNGDKVEITDYDVSGHKMDEVGDYEVTISYTDSEITKEAKYTLHVVQWEGVLSVGSYYVLAAKNTVEEVDHTYSMVGLNKNGTNHYGIAVEYGETLRSESALFVEEGANYNSYAFRLGNGKYLAVNKDANTLTEVDSIDSTSSFTVEIINETNYSITNVEYSERSIKFNQGNATTAPRFSTYKSGQTDVTLVMVSTAEIASHFETNFMHKEISVDNHEDTNACRAEGEGAQSYYALAKAAFNAMPLASRENFLASSEYAARLEAWAIANGEEINADSQLVSAASGSFFDSNDANNNSMIIIIAIASSSAFTFSIALLLRKKKRQ